MNIKSISFLALLPIALVLPFAVNAAATNSTTVTPDADSNQYLFKNLGGIGANANTQGTYFSSLGNQGGTSSVYRNVTGSGVSSSFFSVVADTSLFSATLNSNLNTTAFTSVGILDISTGTNNALTLSNTTNTYNYGSLVAGDIYDFYYTYSVATGANASIFTTTTVAAIPEPEEWAMMLIGLFLIAVKVNQSKNSKSQLNCLSA